MQFDEVISLGGNCEVAQHWRRFSGRERAYPFDWWITPFNSVERLLQDQFSKLLRPENMQVIADKMVVMCNHYVIAHHHDFRRDANLHIVEDMIESDCATGRDKFVSLVERFYEVCSPGKRVLFIRSWRDTLDIPPTVYARDDIIRYDFHRFILSVSKAMPWLDFKVLFVNYGPQKSDHPQAMFHNIVDHNDAVDWSGSPKGWDDMFRMVV